MKPSPRRVFVGAAMASALLLSGFILASSISPSFLSGGGGETRTQPLNGYGRLLVTVMLNDPIGYVGVRGVSVNVVQQIFQGVRLNFVTGEFGSVELPLLPGQYRVGLTETRFALQTQVQVYAGNLTHLAVKVNKTYFQTTFADVSDSAGSGTVNTWETMELAVVPISGFPNLVLLGGIAPEYQGGASAPPCGAGLPTFGKQAFVQTINLIDFGNGAYELSSGPEVQATVLSQNQRNCETWLDLQPGAPIGINGAVSFNVLNYVPYYSVEISNALP